MLIIILYCWLIIIYLVRIGVCLCMLLCFHFCFVLLIFYLILSIINRTLTSFVYVHLVWLFILSINNNYPWLSLVPVMFSIFNNKFALLSKILIHLTQMLCFVSNKFWIFFLLSIKESSKLKYFES